MHLLVVFLVMNYLCVVMNTLKLISNVFAGCSVTTWRGSGSVLYHVDRNVPDKFLEKTVHKKTCVTIQTLSCLIQFYKHYVKTNKNKIFPVKFLFYMSIWNCRCNEHAAGCKSDASGLDSRRRFSTVRGFLSHGIRGRAVMWPKPRIDLTNALCY
jgi:hypothetical protein